MKIITPIAMRDALIESIWIKMKKDKNIFFVSADFGSPVLDKIRGDYPNQFVNVGVAEQNLINISVGLALEGYTVFVYAIAPFIPMRCYEQIRVSIALLSEVRPMNINLIAVGAGVSYAISGPTHQCYEDISLMRALPNFTVLSPSDHIVSKQMFDYCINNKTPKYIRLDVQPLPVLYEKYTADISLGFYEYNTYAGDICFISTGYMTHTALKVAQELDSKVTVIDIFNLTNFSYEKLKGILSLYSKVVTFEEGFYGIGGLDAMIFNMLSDKNTRVLNIGVRPKYTFKIGNRAELHEEVGISVESILKKLKDNFN
jgi:transketolase